MSKIASTMVASRIRELLEDANYEPFRYSGRGMYGKQCVALKTDESLTDVLANLVGGCDDLWEAEVIIRRVRTDSLGLGIVVYWPSSEWL